MLRPELRNAIEEDAARGFLSAVMFSKSERITDVMRWFKSSYLLDPVYRGIVEAICELAENQHPVTVATIASTIQQLRKQHSVSLHAIHELIWRTTSADQAHLRYYCQQVHEQWRRREAISLGGDVGNRLQAGEPNDVIEEYANIPERLKKIGFDDEDKYDQTLVSLKHVPLGVNFLDDVLEGGPVVGNFVIVGAKSGCGKSSFISHICAGMIVSRVPFLLFSFEMDASEVITRWASWLSGCREGDKYVQALDTIREAERLGLFYVICEPYSLSSIRRATATVASPRPKAVFVDYLQLVTTRGDSREQVVSAIARGLKQMAVERKVVVYAATQLVDDSEGVKTRESRAITHAANQVIALFPQSEDDICEVQVQLAKNRSGKTTGNRLMWNRATNRYYAKSRRNDEPPQLFDHQEEPF
jgi:replicative DNA helicase